MLSRHAILGRRRLLQSLGVIAALPVSQACVGAQPTTTAPAATPTDAPKTAESAEQAPAAVTKPAEPTRLAAGAAAAAPTKPPAATAKPTVAPEPFRAVVPGRKKLVFFLPRGDEAFGGTTKFVEAFEQRNPGLSIEIVYAPGHEENPKLFTAIAGGNPPDIANSVDFSIPQWSELGIMRPVDDLFKADGLTPDHFFPAVWGPLNYNGRIWGLPYEVDANFPLFWNKALFREAGLDPEKGPRTTDEVDAMQEKLIKREGDRITRIGIVPWGPYGVGNSVFTWSWVFGGEFVDANGENVTPDHAKVVEGVQWMVDHAKKVGGPDKIVVTPPGFAYGPIFTKNIAMAPMVIHQMTAGRRVFPELELGRSVIFVKPPVQENPAWISGWRNFIPAGSKNPEDAWKFLKFMAVDPDGAKLWFDLRGVFSGWKESPALENLRKHPENSIYLDVLATARNVKPLIPVSSFYQTTIQKEVEEALFGRKSVPDALRATKEATMREWERFRNRRR